MLSGICITLLTLPSVFALTSAASPSCNSSDFQRCMEELQELSNNPELDSVPPEEALSKECGYLQIAVQCVDNVTNQCSDDNTRNVYRMLSTGVQQVTSDLCTQGSELRQRYLTHASCYQNMSLEFKNCADIYFQQQQSTTKNMNSDDALRNSCCTFDGYKDCNKNSALMRCGQEAAEVVEQIMTEFGGTAVQTYCSGYKYNTVNCPVLQSNGVASVNVFHFSYALASCIIFLTVAN